MKKLIIAAAIALGTVAFQTTDAQVRASLNINIGSQPDWGPVGYDQANYYYMPDIDTYYDVPSHQYVYLQDNRWIRSGNLPSRYSNYDIYNGYKVVVNQVNPWNRADYYRSHYASYRGRRGQAMIRDSRDARYQNHWRGNNGNDGRFNNGRGNGNDGRFNNGRGNGNDGRFNNGRGNGNNGHDNNGRGNGNHNPGHDDNRGHGHH